MLSMLIFAAATVVPPQVLVLPNPAKIGQPVCSYEDKGVQTVGVNPPAPVRAQKLNELPNADEYLTVMRIDEKGCQKPAIVAYDIGSAPRKQR